MMKPEVCCSVAFFAEHFLLVFVALSSSVLNVNLSGLMEVDAVVLVWILRGLGGLFPFLLLVLAAQLATVSQALTL